MARKVAIQRGGLIVGWVALVALVVSGQAPRYAVFAAVALLGGTIHHFLYRGDPARGPSRPWLVVAALVLAAVVPVVMRFAGSSSVAAITVGACLALVAVAAAFVPRATHPRE